LQAYTIEIRARRKNKAGLPLIDAMVPGITPPNGYPIPLNLTEDQAAMIEDGKTQYNCHLVRGSLKNGKDGSWDTDYYWDVAMFEGVTNQRVIDSYHNEPNVAVSPSEGVTTSHTPTPVPQKPAAPAIGPDERQLIYMRQTGLNCASNLMASIVKDFDGQDIIENPEMMYQRTVELSERFVGYLATGQSEGLVDTLVQEGANIAGIRDDEEAQYTYPPVPDKVTSATFNDYCTRAGWAADDVYEWLGGELIDWIEQGEGRSTKAALEKCREDAIEQGVLLPPENFRVEVKN
jgi:hypothetical protein